MSHIALKRARHEADDRLALRAAFALLHDVEEAADLRVGERLHELRFVVPVDVLGRLEGFGSQIEMTGSGVFGSDVLSGGKRP